MRFAHLGALILTIGLRSFGQATTNAEAELPSDPEAIFAAAAPYYDFNAATLKPWHLKSSYQLYNQDGGLSEKGTFEYWWAALDVYRVSWTRPKASRTEWHAAGGKLLFQASGETLQYFEGSLSQDYFSPLPGDGNREPTRVRLVRNDQSFKGAKFRCISSIPVRQGRPQYSLMRSFPAFCFDPHLPALRIVFFLGSVVEEYSRIAKSQGRFLPEQISTFVGLRKIFSADVEGVNAIRADDPAFTPAADAKSDAGEPVTLDQDELAGHLIQKVKPQYPVGAAAMHVSGTVVVAVIIGTDGKIEDARVVFAPSTGLGDAAVDAVRQWRYKPFVSNGQPEKVNSTIQVVFSLGG